MSWLDTALQRWPWLYPAVAVLLLAIMLYRGEIKNYLELCQAIGLVGLWPVTLAANLALRKAAARAGSNRTAGQAPPEA